MWQAIEVVEQFQEISGKWYARVLISDTITEETVFVKFQTEPIESEVLLAAQRLCDRRNAVVEE